MSPAGRGQVPERSPSPVGRGARAAPPAPRAPARLSKSSFGQTLTSAVIAALLAFVLLRLLPAQPGLSSARSDSDASAQLLQRLKASETKCAARRRLQASIVTALVSCLFERLFVSYPPLAAQRTAKAAPTRSETHSYALTIEPLRLASVPSHQALTPRRFPLRPFHPSIESLHSLPSSAPSRAPPSSTLSALSSPT